MAMVDAAQLITNHDIMSSCRCPQYVLVHTRYLVEQCVVPSFKEGGEPDARREVTRHRVMAGLGSATPSYPGVAELTRQLDQEKIAMLSKRVDDLRNQNQDLKVNTKS